MLRFKPFIIEHLTDQQYEKHNFAPNTYARKFLDKHFGVKNNELNEPIDMGNANKSEVHQEVEKHIGKHLTKQEYSSGLTQDPKYPTRQIKIGKLINDNGIRDRFNADHTRSKTTTSGDYTMRIVRGPHVAGQTNPVKTSEQPDGHSWKDESCKNIISGSNKDYVPKEVRHGTVVCFAKNNKGEEIYRATLQPHHQNDSYFKSPTVYKLNSEYGLKDPAFTKHAESVAARISDNVEDKSTTFKINHHVYNDNKPEVTLHHGANENDIRKAYFTPPPPKPVKSRKDIFYNLYMHPHHIQPAMAMHEKAPKDVVDHYIYNKDDFGGIGIKLPKKLSNEHIHHILSHPTVSSQTISTLQDSYKLNKNHFNSLLNNPSEKSRGIIYHALSNSSIPNHEKEELKNRFEQENKHTKNEKTAVRIAHNTTNPDVIDTIYKNNKHIPEVARTFSFNEHTPSHIINDIASKYKKDSDILYSDLLRHKNMNDHSIIQKAIDSKDIKNNYALSQNPNLSSEHVHSIINTKYKNSNFSWNKKIILHNMLDNHGISDSDKEVIKQKLDKLNIE